MDEAPFAYRGIDEICEAIKDTVEIDRIIKPIYNFKAGNGTGRSPKKVFINPVKWHENDLFQRVELKDYTNLYSPAETIERAESRLGEEKYDLFLNNCACFALWCKTGESRSYQSDNAIRFMSNLISIGCVGSGFATAFKSGLPKPLMIQLMKEML